MRVSVWPLCLLLLLLFIIIIICLIFSSFLFTLKRFSFFFTFRIISNFSCPCFAPFRPVRLGLIYFYLYLQRPNLSPAARPPSPTAEHSENSHSRLRVVFYKYK